MLHDEADGIAAGAATKALIDLFAGRNGERRGLFVMERAQAEIVSASFLQFHEGAHYFHNIDAAEDLLYGVLRYHVMRAKIKNYELGITNYGFVEKAPIPPQIRNS
jgi:hypothetical protein